MSCNVKVISTLNDKNAHVFPMFCDLCVTRMVCFQLKSFSCFEYDLDLDPMTLILKLDLDMVKMYLHAKMKFSCQGVQKL